jgi:PKD repeat protein
MNRTLPLSLALFLAVTPACWSVESVQVERIDVPNAAQFVPDEFVVRFDPAMGELNGQAIRSLPLMIRERLDELALAYDVRMIKPMFRGAADKGIKGLTGYHRVKIGEGQSLEEAMAAYEALPWVEHVEPIGVHPVYGTPNDSWYANQWHLNQANDHDLDVSEAWDAETGDEAVIVAVLDTGVRYYHKDLGGLNASASDPEAARGNMWINWAEKNGVAGVDDDANGYVDDWVGWDFVDGGTQCCPGEDCDTCDNDPRDFNGHGTHCAGSIGAINNNGYATCSPSGGWGNGQLTEHGNGVKVMACRVGWSGVFSIYEVGYVRMDYCAEAFYYAADNGARIASCSWGSSNSGGLDAAVTYFVNNGGLVFKAAGNSDNETADYLCDRPDVISVAATDENDCKASFSSYGTWVDISAPGVHIRSLYHNHEDPAGEYVASMSGTSMAAPLAASVAALIWSENPDWTAAQVRQRLYDTADDLYGLAGNAAYAGKLGVGRVNALKAVGSTMAPLVADFGATPISGCAPLTANFTDLSIGGITSWSWTFGDGGSSTAQCPSHTYTNVGEYTVSLTVTGPGGSDTRTKTSYIAAGNPPVADFSGSPVYGDAPLMVNFTDQSTGATSWSWDFGDGGASSAWNPVHIFTVAGTYTVRLTASNSCGSDAQIKVGHITVTAPSMQCDDLAGGDISDWGNVTGNWAATGGYMNGNSAVSDAHITSPLGPFSATTINCKVRMNGGQARHTARILFGYEDDSSYRFIEGDDGNDTWNICQRVGETNEVLRSVGAPIEAGRWYEVVVDVAANGNVTLSVDGSPLTSYIWTTAIHGQVGCGYDNANSDFDDFCAGGTGAGAMVQVTTEHVGAGSSETPFGLLNSPNPFKSVTDIAFTLPGDCDVQLVVYDAAGRRVRELAGGRYTEGMHVIPFDGTDEGGRTVSPGVYFYCLKCKGQVESRKMLLWK